MMRAFSVTRRQVGANLARLGSGATLLAGVFAPGVAGAKLPQQAVSYQPTPKGAARCDTCIQWLPPGSCKVVSGAISPSGWCSIYMKK